jgi:hypothetical protein
LLNITHPDDHAFLKQRLIPTDLHNLFAAKTDEDGEIRSRTQEEEEEIDRKLREDRRDFTIRQVSFSRTKQHKKKITRNRFKISDLPERDHDQSQPSTRWCALMGVFGGLTQHQGENRQPVPRDFSLSEGLADETIIFHFTV